MSRTAPLARCRGQRGSSHLDVVLGDGRVGGRRLCRRLGGHHGLVRLGGGAGGGGSGGGGRLGVESLWRRQRGGLARAHGLGARGVDGQAGGLGGAGLALLDRVGPVRDELGREQLGQGLGGHVLLEAAGRGCMWQNARVRCCGRGGHGLQECEAAMRAACEWRVGTGEARQRGNVRVRGREGGRTWRRISAVP